jgi:hypothetical protein
MLSASLTERPAVLIGDLVSSRRSRDRSALHEELSAALARANDACDPQVPLAPTVGDEFQGVFGRLVDTLRATLLVRASMSTPHDVRFGVGIGEVFALGERAGGVPRQDGPGWWAARDAIDFVASGESRRGVPRSLRTWIVEVKDRADGMRPLPGFGMHGDTAELRALNAYVVARDHLVSAMDDRDRRILRGLLEGKSVTDIAESEEISASAVSQRGQRSGAAAIAFSLTALDGGSA